MAKASHRIGDIELFYITAHGSSRLQPLSRHFTVHNAMSSKTNGFAQGTVLRVAYSMLAWTSCVVLARAGVCFFKPRRVTASDYLVYFAFACYATMCALYISLSPHMQRLYDVANGVIPPYPEMESETVHMTKMIFAAPCMFWMTLWRIKFSLLFLYRGLLVGLPRSYTLVWWSIVGLCIVVSPL